MLLCKAMRLQRAAPNEIIISQGEVGDAFYAIFSGSASVYVTYDVGSAPADATAEAMKQPSGTESGKVAPLPAEQIKEIDARIHRHRRHERGEMTPEPKARSDVRRLRRSSQALASVPAHAVTQHSSSQQRAATDDLSQSAGRDIPAAGAHGAQAQARRGSIAFGSGFTGRRTSSTPLVRGALHQCAKGGGPPETNRGRHTSAAGGGAAEKALSTLRTNAATVGAIKNVLTYTEYDSFGDLALLFEVPRSASVVAEVETLLVRVERSDYDAVVKSAALDAVRLRASFLSSLPCFYGIPFQRLFKLASYLKREEYSAGASILPLGHKSSEMLIVQDGEVEVHSPSTRGAPPRRLLTLGHGTCLGSLDMDSTTTRMLLPSLKASSSGGGVAILRICRAEFEYRAGRRIVGQMGEQEAGAWLMRINAPGPLRAMVTGSRQIAFKAMGTYAVGQPSPDKNVDESSDMPADLSKWLESERARLRLVAADKSLDHRHRRKRGLRSQT